MTRIRPRALLGIALFLAAGAASAQRPPRLPPAAASAQARLGRLKADVAREVEARAAFAERVTAAQRAPDGRCPAPPAARR